MMSPGAMGGLGLGLGLGYGPQPQPPQLPGMFSSLVQSAQAQGFRSPPHNPFAPSSSQQLGPPNSAAVVANSGKLMPTRGIQYADAGPAGRDPFDTLAQFPKK